MSGGRTTDVSVIGAPKEGMIKPQLTAKEQVRATLGRMRPGPAHWVDTVFTIAVVACGLVGLRTVVFGWEWWRAAAVGVLLGLVLGHIQGTYRWPLVATTALGAAMYFLLGGILAVRDDVKWGVLPTGQTFKDLAAGPISGWMDLLTLVPPVDARGHILAVPLFIALVATTLTYATARITRSRLRLVATPFALLAVTIALGTMEPASLLVQGLLLALLLIGWVVARDHLDPDIGIARPGMRRPALSRVVSGTLILLVAALVGGTLGPYLPGRDHEDERRVVRTGVVPGHDTTIMASPLSRFRNFTQDSPSQLYNREILRVEGVPRNTPMRLATLDTWDGSTWGIAGRGDTRADAGRSFQQFGRRVGVLASGRPTQVKVTVPEEGYTGGWLLTSGRVEGIEFLGAAQKRLQDKAWLNLSTNTVLVPPGLRPGDTYEVRTALPPEGSGALPESLPVSRGDMPMTGDTTFVDARIQVWKGDSQDPWQQFRQIATTMREEGTYTDGTPATGSEAPSDKERAATARTAQLYPAGHGQGRLDRFLNSEVLAGNDEQYAATLGIIGNRLGIPTRVVVGATATDDGLLRGRDIHAWVEVRLRDGSWYQVLPQTFVPDRAEQATPADNDPQEWDKPAAEPPPPPPEEPAPPPEPVVDWSSPSTWPLWAQLLAVFVLLPLLVLLLTPVVTAVRRAVRLRRGTPDQRVGRAWNDLLEEARVLGVPLPAGGTRMEQARALGPQVDAAPAAMRADALVFGPAPADPTAVGHWQGELRQVRRRLRRTAPFGSRVRATFDPRSLLSRHEDIGMYDTTTSTRKALR
ncbi:transglutaminase-like domain-containing protein [Janibacter sp. YB324]|uniref:transglutaminase domain-containing protein n=1 Tax=Janibacter sp. YB324 TaxID=2761047 RepID=UPI001623D9FB|nr:transglutaminase-like domain-containing protein [Janibacter sp. YB324]QNF94248.1 transglutaminase domain-containing protein [Janibacter sp. YB324]